MKAIKMTLVIAACATLLTGCSTFKDLFTPDNDQQKGAPELSQVSGTDDIGGFDDESLSARPDAPWTRLNNLNFPTVYFAFDQYRIGTTQMKKLNDVADYLNKYSALGVILEGYCDEKGSAEYNIGLGERRALSAYKYLENLGIPASRMQTISYGSEKPADPGHNEAAWAKNRRVEVIPAKM